MRVTLLHPDPGGKLQTHRRATGHLGLGYIAACLLQRGHDVRVLDAQNIPISDEDLVRHVAEFQPDLFGVTAMTHEVHAAAHACGLAKNANPSVLTVIGGPHTTALPERTLREFPAVDVAAIGEGEMTMCELADMVRDGLPRPECRQVRGIAFRDGDAIHRTPDRPWLEDLDSLPFPAWHLFPKVCWPVFASRGCPYGCIFCMRVLGRRLRLRSVDNVLAELDALEQQEGQRVAWFQDETFGVNRRWIDELLTKLVERNKRNGYAMEWGCNSRVNLADIDLYRAMREAGCNELGFGVESGNDEILKRIQKGTSSAMAIKAIATAREVGIRTGAFFIIGHPGETWKTALQTVCLAARCRSDSIAVGVMVPYPGTEIWNMARNGEYGYKLTSEDWRCYDKYFGNALELQGLSRHQLEALQMLALAWHIVYNFQVRRLFRYMKLFHAEALAMLKRVLGFGIAPPAGAGAPSGSSARVTAASASSRRETDVSD
jgi:radical SAM superfamily enzyme YgiQ (UPF0313 family)